MFPKSGPCRCCPRSRPPFDLVYVTLCYGLMAGDRADWDFVYDVVQGAGPDSGALACSRDEDTLRQYCPALRAVKIYSMSSKLATWRCCLRIMSSCLTKSMICQRLQQVLELYSTPPESWLVPPVTILSEVIGLIITQSTRRLLFHNSHPLFKVFELAPYLKTVLTTEEDLQEVRTCHLPVL